ncbi:hypothetical protein LWM68_20250 [Niabella sp. W65]|nr:hypothetical protein [Niabella sp. W65]MCH7364888.1 hypothetical protein [Niabella sp. W65]ULT40722.1 hypothetical protein KRR40_39175 [Niabella sp. I65]
MVELAKLDPGTPAEFENGKLLSFGLPNLWVIGNQPDWASWWKRVEAMYGNNMPWVLDYQPLLPMTWTDVWKGFSNAGLDMAQDFTGVTGLAADKFSEWMTGSGLFRYNLDTDNANSVYAVATITLALIEPTPAGEISAGARGLKRAYTVYHGLDEAGTVRYVGITSRNPALRIAEHKQAFGTGKELLDYEVIEGANNLSRSEARVLEQTLINQHGLQKNGGLLLNQINSIVPTRWGISV